MAYTLTRYCASLTRDDLKKSIQMQVQILKSKGTVFHTFWKKKEDENYEVC